MDGDLRRQLRSEGQGIQATVHVGKDGLDAGVLAELDAQLKRHHLVKVRIQHGAVGGDRKSEQDLAQELASSLEADLVERRGHTALIYRRRKGGNFWSYNRKKMATVFPFIAATLLKNFSKTLVFLSLKDLIRVLTFLWS